MISLFLWCILAYKSPVDKNNYKTSAYSMHKSTLCVQTNEFPIKFKDYTKFEKL